jgi:hypothetical protein
MINEFAQQTEELEDESYEQESISEGYDEQAEKDIRLFAETYLADVRALAVQYIDQFFADKRLYCGGKIPKWILHAEQRISMVMNYDIINSVDRAYEALELTISPEETAEAMRTGEATKDIKLVNDTLNMLAGFGVPKPFAGGIMLLYLEYVEGVEIGI